MLSPRYLDGLSDEIIEIYSQLETDILQDMARRIARLGKITDATRWQAQMLTEAGGLQEHIRKTLKKYDAKTVRAVTAVYKEALEKNAANDNRIFSEALGRTISAPNTQAMLSTIQKCHSDLSRLTLTTAATSQQQFVREANRVYMNVQSGAFGYDTAMKDAADALAKRGITTVQYENGRPVTRTIESAVRMNILTSINQTAANQTLSNCEELGCDLVETSAHIGARPEHEEWQGQIFSRSGNNKKYRPFSVCELGSPTGICGINCRHSFYPYFEGMENHYTEKELDEMAGEKVTFNGREMTRYEGEQKLRGIERNIRAYKRQALIQEAAGADNTAARRKLGEWQAAARNFTKQTGIARDSTREWIGTKDGVQPRGIFTRTETAPATTGVAQTPTLTATTTTKATEEKLKTLTDNPKSNAREYAERRRIESRAVFAYEEQPTEADIIARLAGGDRTSGSCSSLANAYIANKGGFEVLDFRGGKSLDLFSQKSTSLEMAKFNGVNSFTATDKNGIKAGNELLARLEVSKEYKLGVGSHAAIVRKLKDGTRQYLELQSAESNGWKNFTDDTLKSRFKCKILRKYYQTAYLIELESLAKNREFIELMQYINTAENAQLKGIGGWAR